MIISINLFKQNKLFLIQSKYSFEYCKLCIYRFILILKSSLQLWKKQRPRGRLVLSLVPILTIENVHFRYTFGCFLAILCCSHTNNSRSANHLKIFIVRISNSFLNIPFVQEI